MMSSKGETTPLRRTQRAPKSCTTCSKKKIRCSPFVPCLPCIKGGSADQCRRETVRVKGAVHNPIEVMPVDLESLELENARLRERVAELEHRLSRMEGTVPSPRQEDPKSSATPDQATVGAQEDKTALIEEFLMGIQRLSLDLDPSSSDLPHNATAYPTPQLLCRSMLPESKTLNPLLSFCYAWTWWRTSAYHVPTFQAQVEEMLSTEFEKADWGWVGLLLSILAAGIFYMEDWEARNTGLDPDRRRSMAEGWIKGILLCLFNANYMEKPTLTSVQTIVIVSDILYALGHSRLHDCLQSTSISIARSLDLHKLGQETVCPLATDANGLCAVHLEYGPHIELTSEVIARELGRRTWLRLMVTEYQSLSVGERATTPPSGTLPLNINDAPNGSVVRILPSSVFTGVTHHLMTYQAALIYNRHHLDKNSGQVAIDQADKALSGLLDQNMTWDDSAAVYAPWARHALVVAVNHRKLKMRFSLFAGSLRQERLSTIRTECINAALSIKTIRSLANSGRFDRTSGIIGATLTAACVLAFDLFHTSYIAPDLNAKRTDVLVLLQTLKRANNDLPGLTYVDSAVSILSWLLTQEDDFRGIYAVPSLA